MALKDSDHMSRYCSPRTIESDGNPSPMAFEPRTSDNYLSANWLEYFKESNFVDAIVKIREIFHSKGFIIKQNGRFAILNVGETKSVGRNADIELRIKLLPEYLDKSHTGIFGYTEDDSEITANLAILAKRSLYPAIDRE